MNLSAIPFRVKLLILVLVPVIFILIASAVNIQSSLKQLAIIDELEQEIQLAIVNSELVHEMQKERGMTAGFLGSKGQSFASALKTQRKQTDTALSRQRQLIQSLTFSNEALTSSIENIDRSLQQISTTRGQVDNQTIQLSQALGYYTQLNGQLLNLTFEIAKLSPDENLAINASAYNFFLLGKERAGIERAVLSNAFSQQALPSALYQKFITLVAEQNSYINSHKQLALPENLTRLAQLERSSSVVSVNRYREQAHQLAQGQAVNAQAVAWFEQATKRINLLKEYEDQLAVQLQGDISGLAENASNQLWIYLAASLAVLIATFIISWVLIKDIDKVVDYIYRSLLAAQNHDLTSRVDVVSNDQFGKISTAFNRTMDSFAQAMKQLASHSETLSGSVNKTASDIKLSEKHLLEQQQSTSMIATAIEEMTATVEEVSANILQAAQAANQAAEQTDQSQLTVKKTVSEVEELASEIDNISATIGLLNESSNEISSIVDVIKAVAEQTNLLALNAAIEAARAGEQGRGFAVVADEVRGLAQRTQDSTQEIEAIVSKVQKQAEQAFGLIETGKVKAANTCENAKLMETTLTQINQAIREINKMTEQIATAAEEQVAVTNDVSEHILRVDNNGQKTVESAGLISSSAAEQAKMAEHLKALSGTYRV